MSIVIGFIAGLAGGCVVAAVALLLMQNFVKDYKPQEHADWLARNGYAGRTEDEVAKQRARHVDYADSRSDEWL